MLPLNVTIPATVPQRWEIPEGLRNYPVFLNIHTQSSYLLDNKTGLRAVLFAARDLNQKLPEYETQSCPSDTGIDA